MGLSINTTFINCDPPPHYFYGIMTQALVSGKKNIPRDAIYWYLGIFFFYQKQVPVNNNEYDHTKMK